MNPMTNRISQGCTATLAATCLCAFAAAQTTDYLIPAADGRSLGLETRWLAHVAPSPGAATAQAFTCDGDSVFVTDSACHMSRVLVASGNTVWTNACGRATDHVLDIDRASRVARIPAGKNGDLTPPTQLDEVLVTLDAAIASFDTNTGQITQTQRLERIPSTRSILHGRYLIFGARGGQLVWQQYAIGHLWKCNEVGGSIVARPIRLGSAIAVAGTSGEILVVDPDTTRQVWRRRLAGSVVGSLAAGDDALFAASADQAIHAFEAATGRPRWRFLTETPLSCDLFCDGARVYAQIPQKGLIALATKSETLLEAKVAWTAQVPGNAIARAGHRILVWDAASHTLTAVAAESGHVEGKVTVPSIVDLVVADPVSARMFVLGAGGTLQLLEALDKSVVAAE